MQQKNINIEELSKINGNRFPKVSGMIERMVTKPVELRNERYARTKISGCIEEGHFDFALQAIEEGIKAGVNGKALYGTAIDACLARGDWVEPAFDLVTRASKSGIELKITKEQYRTAIDSCVGRGHVGVALEIVNEAAEAGVKDEKIYGALLDACIIRGWVDPAVEVVDRAIGAGVKDDSFFAKTVDFFHQYNKIDAISKVIEYLNSTIS